jgi:uncharacterized membrane protein YeiH
MGVRMNPESKGVLKWTLWSALLSFAAFAGVTATQAMAEGGNPIEHWGVIVALGVIGGTVGGLVGPMIRGISLRFRKR